MIRVLLIDNYDSFTWNLVQLLRESGLCYVDVVSNNRIGIEGCAPYNSLLISPGPGLPHEAGIICEVIRHWAPRKNILGVCLGHQAIATVFGASLVQLPFPKHGSREPVITTQPVDKIFRGLPENFQAGRYHSWVVDSNKFPEVLQVTATDEEGNIMALRHREYNLTGLQFHPESIMTAYGRQMILNWLRL